MYESGTLCSEIALGRKHRSFASLRMTKKVVFAGT